MFYEKTYLILLAKIIFQSLEISVICRRVNSNNGVFGNDSMATVSTRLRHCFVKVRMQISDI